jgi:transcriptional regulator with XRE-family HTH domain
MGTINAFGFDMRRMRLLRGMKQQHLAQLLGVDQATISRWERGTLAPSKKQSDAARRLLVDKPAPMQDMALKRLVESSTQKVHLICSRSHRLLAASPARTAAWQVDATTLLGTSMLGYASDDILEAEASLNELGWHEGEIAALEVRTGANRDPYVPIAPGTMLWERIVLADGTIGRLVTTVA